MTEKIEAAKQIAATVSSDVAKISAEISQCVAMGAKAYTFIRILDIVTSTVCVLFFVAVCGYITNKYISHRIKIREEDMKLEKEKFEKRGY